jgi:hypothetical protein
LSEAPCGQPANCVWTRQIQFSLTWLLAFLKGQNGTIIRRFDLWAFMGFGLEISITMDASPWGLGAIIKINNCFHKLFASPLTSVDVERFGTPLGVAEGQQTWECLCALVALRHWAPLWRNQRCQLTVRSDSMAALTAVLTAKADGPGTSLVAQELALDMAEAVYTPRLVSH